MSPKKGRERDYRAAVTCMDDAIGALMKKLEDVDVLDDTIVIFFLRQRRQWNRRQLHRCAARKAMCGTAAFGCLA